MKQEIDQLGYIQFDHLKWTNELNFITKEIGIYQDRLLELFEEYDDDRVIDDLSDMYDDFEIGKEQAIKIQAEIQKHIIENKVRTHWNGNLKTMINTIHLPTKNKLNDFVKKHADLKNRFQRFSTLQNGNV